MLCANASRCNLSCTKKCDLFVHRIRNVFGRAIQCFAQRDRNAIVCNKKQNDLLCKRTRQCNCKSIANPCAKEFQCNLSCAKKSNTIVCAKESQCNCSCATQTIAFLCAKEKQCNCLCTLEICDPLQKGIMMNCSCTKTTKAIPFAQEPQCNRSHAKKDNKFLCIKESQCDCLRAKKNNATLHAMESQCTFAQKNTQPFAQRNRNAIANVQARAIESQLQSFAHQRLHCHSLKNIQPA